MDVLKYIEDLIPEIKIIILSYLPSKVLLEINPDQSISEILFKLISEKYYSKIKKIIRLNKALDFQEYNSEGPYLWYILLKDQLYYDILNYKYRTIIDYTPWDRYFEHMNIISINFSILIRMYEMYPNYYKYLKSMIRDQHALHLLNVSIHNMIHVSPFDVIFKEILTSDKNFEKINISLNGEYINLIEYVMLIYFLRQFMDRKTLTYSNNEIDEAYNLITNISSEDHGWMYSTLLEYEKYENLINKYMKFIKYME